MIVCVCGNVNVDAIEKSQATNLEEFKSQTGACVQCCSCCETLEYFWNKYHEK